MDGNSLSKVQAELAELQAKSADLADQYLRAKAEAENARRRAEDEISKARRFAVEAFAESLLPVADSLEAGLLIKDASTEQIREGAQATLRQLLAALERNKVAGINPAAGTRFDPHQHQAISVVPSDLEANSVVTVLQKATPLQSGCCARPWLPSAPPNKNNRDLKSFKSDANSSHLNTGAHHGKNHWH